MKEKNNCLIQRYYSFVGRKWSYAILFFMKKNKEYSFEDFVHITNRKMSRSLILSFLNEAQSLGVIKKNKYIYIV